MKIDNRIWRRTALAVALSMGFGGVALAQSNATGSIFGDTGTTGTSVRITNPATGFSRDVQVQNGRYRLSSLPVGTYTVTLLQDGKEIASQNVTVQIGGGVDASFAAATQAQTLEGISVVASALPAIDVSQVDTRTVLTAETLQKIPVARNVTAAALLAPGTVSADSRYGNVASFGGASASENQYYVNGFPVTNSLTGIGFAQLPFDAIDQQQVITGGYGAEYGRSTGGVVNIVTKSGTNEWKAGVEAYWSPRALKDSPRDIYYPMNPASAKAGQLFQDRSENTTNDITYGAYIGGPLIKDKLFMYLTGEAEKQSGSAGIGSNAGAGTTRTDETDKSHRWLAKINWNINDNNILEFTGMGDKNSTDSKSYYYDYATGQTGAFVGSERSKNRGTAGSEPGGNLYIGKYTGYLTDDLTVTALYGKTHTTHSDVALGSSGAPCPLVIDARNVDPSQQYATCWTATQVLAPGAKDDTKGWRLDVEYHLGDHDLRAGLDTQDLSSYSGTTYSGGVYHRYMDWSTAVAGGIESEPGYTPPATTPQYVVRNRIIGFVANVSVKQEAQYLEDRWQISDRWMAYLGLRNEQFANYNGQGQVYVKQRHQLAPRLGVTWDVFGDSSFKVYANAGRYHLAIPANVAIRGASASLFSNQYFTYTGVDPTTGAPQGLAPITGVRYINGSDGVTAPDPRTVAAKGLKAYYQDEYILGFDKTLGPDWTFGAKATYRNLKSIIDDFCDDAPFQAYAARTGTDISNARISGCYLFNPGQNNTFSVDMGDGTFQDFNLTKEDFAGNANGIGYPDLERKYLSLDVYLLHSFANNWYGKLEYVWSKNYGDAEGMLKSDIGQQDPSVTQDWDFPELMVGSRGYLPNDRRHEIKAYGYWQMNPEWLLGASAIIQSGRPKNCIGNPPDGYDRQGYGASFFFCDFGTSEDDFTKEFTPRGSQGRLPWTYQLNLSAQYTPAWADHKLAFTVDVFNVLAQQRAMSIVETQSDVTDPNHGRVISYQTPRSVRLGMRYDFSL
ncbi:TonB-dependent receptor [Fulvimonas yonginensis]|uniref:TonB-dependent receptor n=1 Tax=Fulvimonas yonginensis TaxID=1495200 RepID=A0ABU8J861_9GAMM